MFGDKLYPLLSGCQRQAFFFQALSLGDVPFHGVITYHTVLRRAPDGKAINLEPTSFSTLGDHAIFSAYSLSLDDCVNILARTFLVVRVVKGKFVLAHLLQNF